MTFFFELLAEMTIREVKARYKNTAFGFLWAFINPLIQMIIIGVIFRNFVDLRGGNYYLFVYIGLVLWNFFSTALAKSTPSILYERALIRKAKFPYAVIPLSIVLSNFIHTLPSIGIVLIIALSSYHITFITILTLVGALLLLLLFVVGLTLSTSALNVRYRDMNFFIQALLIVWFYATPIVYPTTLLPKNYDWLWYINPLTTVMQLAQVAVGGTTFPTIGVMLTNVSTIIVVCFFGIRIFTKHSPYFDDLI